VQGVQLRASARTFKVLWCGSSRARARTPPSRFLFMSVSPVSRSLSLPPSLPPSLAACLPALPSSLPPSPSLTLALSDA